MFPLKRFDICNQKRNKVCLISLFVVAVIFYSFSFVTTGIEMENERPRCVTYHAWFAFVRQISFVDIFLTILMPFCIIIAINVSISFKLMKFSNVLLARERQSAFARDYHECNFTRLTIMSRTQQLTPNSTFSNIARYDYNNSVRFYPQLNKIERDNMINSARPLMTAHYNSLLSKRAQLKRNRTYSKTTRILTLISFTYILLNSLMAYSKLSYFFGVVKFTNNNNNNQNVTVYDAEMHHQKLTVANTASLNEEIVERISCYLYYLNFSINFFLYASNKAKFRQILVNSIRRKLNFFRCINLAKVFRFQCFC